VEADVAAPAALVFQMLAAVGQGAQAPGERAEVVAREGDRLVVDFWTPVALVPSRTWSVRTREAVRAMPPNRIEYEHLDGPVRGLRESIEVVALDAGRCRLVYRGSFDDRRRFRRLAFRLVSRRAVERAVARHFSELRPRAEARARRSRVFRPGA
jgi:hypothetical protein